MVGAQGRSGGCAALSALNAKAEFRQVPCSRYSIWAVTSGHDRRVKKEKGEPVQRCASQLVAGLEDCPSVL